MKPNLLTLHSFFAVALLLTGTTVSPEAAGRRIERPAARKSAPPPVSYPTIGTIERLDPALDALIAPDASIELLDTGFAWSEGPVWVRSGNCLLFSDVPKNVVYRWQEGGKSEVFLQPSGYTLPDATGNEPGSNGLALDSRGYLVLCQHGDRRVARLEKDGRFTTLAQYYHYRRFNSPNDLVFRSNGDLYFTDPPYGLPKLNNDPAKELSFNGVFRLTTKGKVELLTADLTFPNGVAFSPNEKTLYVAVSDPKQPVIMAYDVNRDGSISKGRVFFDGTELVKQKKKGLPDGLKVDRAGNVFSTGPGGVLVFSPDGRHLGTINTGEATANCAWGDDGSVLYITAHMNLCRIKTLTKGKGF